MTRDPYNVYPSKRRSGRRWRRILFWSAVTLIVVIVGAIAGNLLWLDAKVRGANDRMSDEALEALAEEYTTTTVRRPGAELPQMETTTTTLPDAPDAMDILLVGSDRRSGSGESYGRSDTIMLMHVDPGNDYLSTISFPRDLRVDVKGYGKQKLNAAYAYGGPALTIRTVQELTGVDIDHYLEVDFQAFTSMTNKLGGVYIEVDRRYYYGGSVYDKIDLQPGYQLLYGGDALDYVRFRHDGNLDFGRMDRQQRFMTAVRQQAMDWDLALKLHGLIAAFFDNVTTDMGTGDFIKLAWWGIGLESSRIRQVTVRGSTQTISGGSYVVVSDSSIASSVKTFLTVPGTEASNAEAASSEDEVDGRSVVDLSGVSLDVLNSTADTGVASATAEWLQSLGATVITVGNSLQKVTKTQVYYPPGEASSAQAVASFIGTSTTSEADTLSRITVLLASDYDPPGGYATPDSIPSSAIWKGVAKNVSLPVRAPGYIPSGYTISRRSPDNATVYDIKVGDGSHPAYVMLYKLGGRDQYINLTGTTWLEAPVASEGRRVTHNGIVYTVVGGADSVERVWWRSDGALYWVSNTLSRLVGEQELLKMAQSAITIPAQ